MLHSTKIPGLIRQVEALGKERYFSDKGGTKNLYLRVQPSGSIAWVIRKREGKKLQLTTLGHWNNGRGMTLAEAREKAASLDPKAAAHRMTLGQFLREYYADRKENGYKRPHQLEGYINRLERDEARLWNTKLRDLDGFEIFEALKRYAREHGKVSAARLTSILKTAFRYAFKRSYMSDSPISALTPTDVGGKEKSRKRVLNDAEIEALWRSNSSHTPLLRFLLLTGQRIGETQLATWEHIKGDVWHIPADVTKNEEAHWVPLTSMAMGILNAQDQRRRKVFGITSNTATQAWLKRWCEKHAIDPAFTPHDLRRTFRTRLSELGVAEHIGERMINHKMQGVMAVYNHAEYANERRDAAARWESELKRLVGPA